MREQHYLTSLFEPKSVAIIGASQRSGSIGADLVRNMQGAGFHGALYAVNPNHKQIFGIHSYASIEDVPQCPDLAVIATIHGRHDEALGLYAIALPVYQRLGNVNGLAESYHNAAIALRKLQRLAEADEHEQRAADFARQARNDHLVALIFVGRAEISLLRGDAALAEARAIRAAKELGGVPDPVRQADAIRLCGVAQLALGKLEFASASLDRAVQLSAANGNALIEAESLWARAQVWMARGERARALTDARHAFTIFARLDAPTELATIGAWLAALQRPPT